MIRVFALSLILSIFTLAAGWDAPCEVPDGKMIIPHPDRTNTDNNSTAACSHLEGIYYYCYSESEKREIWTMGDPVSPGSSSCNVNIKVEWYFYPDANCGTDAFLNNQSVCECNHPAQVFDPDTLTCSCPEGTFWNGDTCEVDCTAPRVYNSDTRRCDFPDCMSYKECDMSAPGPYDDGSGFVAPEGSYANLYSVYSCDGFKLMDLMLAESSDCSSTANPDNNTTDGSSTDDNATDTGDTYDPDYPVNTVGGDTSVTNDFHGVETKLNETNTNLATVAGLVKRNTDVLHSDITSQGNKLHDDINGLTNTLENSQNNLEMALGTLNETNKYGINGLVNAINGLAESAASDGGEGNTTISLDDSRIVQANNNTTAAINSIGSYLGADVNVTDLNVSFDEYAPIAQTVQDSIDSMNSAISDMNMSKDDLQAMIEEEATDSLDQFEDKSKSMLSDLLDRIFSNSFTPFQPMIDVGSDPSNFGTIHFPVNIDPINFHKDVYVTQSQLLGDKSDPSIAKFYDIIKKLSMFLAVFFGFLYLIRGVSDV